MGFIIVLEEIFELGLVKDDDCVVDDGDLVVVGHFEGDFSRKRFETVAIEFPRSTAFEGGRRRNGFGNVESLGFAVFARIGEFGDDAFDFLEFVDMVAHGINVAIFVLDEMNKSLGAADVTEFGAINDLVFAVGFFVFAALEAFVGFFDNIAGGFLHEHSLDAGGEGVGVADAIRSVVFVEEEEFDGNVVFDFVDFVGPVEDIDEIGSATRRSRGRIFGRRIGGWGIGGGLGSRVRSGFGDRVGGVFGGIFGGGSLGGRFGGIGKSLRGG